ncbi:MAG: pyridoxamine 5'-phosphate oxidase family protein [Dehalococcoidia bacterium]|nr:pyridoxamine 5'-phosphate oxidase family protein [Dehalococcoidia bacterium]NUQ55673.1 pyridoxamine 5'-phosphate oxidase family protein [Dehalococcoidia bacterium]
MPELLDREAILREAVELARTQHGGALATMHAEDGTPYLTFVLFHLRDDGTVLFASAARSQHARNIAATPEVSFLVDNREVIRKDWTAFDRLVIEGRAVEVPARDQRHELYLRELGAKDRLTAHFISRGELYCIIPRRIVLMKGIDGGRHVADFGGAE